MKVFGWKDVYFKNALMHDAQRTGIVAGGIFYNVPPGTATWFYLKDEDKNFCLALFVGWNCC